MKSSVSETRNCLIWYSKKEATHFSQISVNLHQTALCYIPENSKLNCKDVKFFFFLLQFYLHLLFPLFLFYLPLPSLLTHCYLTPPPEVLTLRYFVYFYCGLQTSACFEVTEVSYRMNAAGLLGSISFNLK